MVSTLEQMQVPKGTGPGVRRSKRPLLASLTRCNVLWKPLSHIQTWLYQNTHNFADIVHNIVNTWGGKVGTVHDTQSDITDEPGIMSLNSLFINIGSIPRNASCACGYICIWYLMCMIAR